MNKSQRNEILHKIEEYLDFYDRIDNRTRDMLVIDMLSIAEHAYDMGFKAKPTGE